MSKRTDKPLNKHETIDALDNLSVVYAEHFFDFKNDLKTIAELMKKLLTKIDAISIKQEAKLADLLALTPNIDINKFKDDPVINEMLRAFFDSQNKVQSKLSNLNALKTILKESVAKNNTKKGRNVPKGANR